MVNKKPWFEEFNVETIQKRVGRKIEPENVAINKTSISFGTRLIPVFEEAKSVQIDTITKNGEIVGLLFSPKSRESEGYTIRTPEDRRVIQTSLPKSLRPKFEKQKIFGEYRGEIYENSRGFKGQVVSVRFT